MSLASSGLSLIHLTTTQRDMGAASDSWGGKGSPDWQDYLTDLPCRYWVDAGREQVDATTEVVVEDMRVIVQRGTDVTEKDQLGDITDAAGNVIVPGPTGIRAVLANADHLELILVRLG